MILLFFFFVFHEVKVSMDTFAVRFARSKYPWILLLVLKSYLFGDFYEIVVVLVEKADERRLKVHGGARHRQSKRALK